MDILKLIAVIGTAAKHVGVSSAILVSLCFTESGLQNIHRANDGGSPTLGVCQVKKKAAVQAGRYLNDIKLQNVTVEELKDPALNAYASAGYLKYQLTRYHGSYRKALSAYNLGNYQEDENKNPPNINYVRGILGRVRGKFVCLRFTPKPLPEHQPLQPELLAFRQENRL